MSQFDAITLQRLIDGELDLEQVQGLLQVAEADPESWKTIAVAMIEDQLWERSMRQHMAVLKLDETLPSTDAPQAPKDATQTDPQIPSTNAKTGPVLGGSFKFPNRWFMAAILIASIGIGFVLAQLFGQSGGANLSRMANTSAKQASHAAAYLAANLSAPTQPKSTVSAVAEYKPEFHLEFPSGSQLSEAGVGPRNPVPVFRVSNADQLRQYRQKQEQRQPVPREFYQQLQREGYQVEENIEFVSGNLDNQRSFIVPVRRVRLLPGQ